MRSREAEFERKLAQTGLRQLPDLLQALPDETARLARLCYAASPAGDWLDTPPEVFFSCAAHARFLRENAAWTRALPEPLFLAYVLHPRVNNEALCDCRPVFYAALAERLRGLPEEAAVLEINRWCAEHVVYQPTDERTRSALAVLRAGFGRCGEESMFAVNVLRACGFAARQVYVPRWAHCDDNHAWVEVRCGGAWHFLGACEPEAVLDRGWFNSAAGRAVLVHSRCFGEPEPGADLIGREGDVVYCNETARYADVRRLTVRVTDENGMPAAGADVDFCILNNCEWYPAATVQTDASGMAALTCGLGSLRLLARRDGLCCEAFVSPEETGPVVLTLGKRAPAPDRWEPIELTAPRGGAVRGAVPTEAQRDLQERWLRQAHEAWTQRREARLDEADAQGLPPEPDGLEPGQIDEKQQAGHHLADDCSNAGTNHPHAQGEDEDGVQNQVQDRAGDHAAHAVPWAAVRPDDGGESRTDQLKGQPPGDGPEIGHGLRPGGGRGAEEPGDLGGAAPADGGGTEAAEEDQGEGVADGVVRLPLLPPAQAQADVGGAAVPQQQGRGIYQNDHRKGHVDGRHGGDPHALAHEDLVHDVVEAVDHQRHGRGHSVAEDQPLDGLCLQRAAGRLFRCHGIPSFRWVPFVSG